MTSDGGQPPKPKDASQGTLLGFPQQPKEPEPPPRKPQPPPPAKHKLPPPRGARSTEAPPSREPPSGSHAALPPAGAQRPASADASPPPHDASRSGLRGAPPNPDDASHSGLRGAPPPADASARPSVAHTAIPASGPATAIGVAAVPAVAPPSISGPSAGVPHSQTQPQFGSLPNTVPTAQLGDSAPNTAPTAAPATSAPMRQFGSDPAFMQPSIVTQPPQALSHPDGGPRDWGIAEDLAKTPSKFVSFLKISAKRAFRLRIEPSEVLDSEREELERASPPIVDTSLQAFLAWRRSVVFLVCCALTPLAVIGFFDALLVGQATPIRVLKMAPVIAEFIFLGICWLMLREWAHWRKQRRWLFRGWLLFIGTPFVVFLYPLRTVFEHVFKYDDLKALNVTGVVKSMLPLKIAMVAMLQLAPKAISMMPGLTRASLVIKLLFPGSTAPGWLIVVAAPLYALLAYVILIVPYQFTGSGWFIGGVLGIIAGQILLARAGFALARPLTQDEALDAITRVRKVYISVMVGSLVLIIIALGSLVVQLNLSALDVIMTILKFETNVLILTLIGSDLVLANLDKARSATAGRDHVEDEAEAKIAAFVSLDAPHVPPPRGPAPLARDFDHE